MKRCTKCGETKSLEAFHKNRNAKDGLVSSCILCYRKWRAENRDRLLARRKEIDKNDPRPKLLSHARLRAKAIGVEFDLSVDDITIPTVCPVLGIPIIKGDGVVCDNSPSIDRTDPHGGYTKDNVTVISFRANTLKSNATIRELKMVVEWLERNNYGI